ncbi:uncharacterized protein LOC141637415 [Silene latifolia]|uniref:uncharacterized protein LOC141637415 n=1 Tax=Silene latifolia TaxID=37657 RepID=UPI003D782569
MLIDVAILQINALISTFEKYRDTGFFKAMETTKDIAKDMDIDPSFPKRRRKKQFDEGPDYSSRLNSIDDLMLESCCVNLENVLRNNADSDIDGNALYLDLKFFKELMLDTCMGPLAILNHMKKVGGCFPNAVTTYRILLTTPITVASAERSFSKLKLLKSYLRSTMSQDRLNGLAMIAIKNKVLDKFCYEELIDDFASKSARRASMFKK